MQSITLFLYLKPLLTMYSRIAQTSVMMLANEIKTKYWYGVKYCDVTNWKNGIIK